MKKQIAISMLILLFLIGCQKKEQVKNFGMPETVWENPKKLSELYTERIPDNILYKNGNVKYEFFLDKDNDVSYNFYDERKIILEKNIKLTKFIGEEVEEDLVGTEIFLRGPPVNEKKIIRKKFLIGEITVDFLDVKGRIVRVTNGFESGIKNIKIYRDEGYSDASNLSWAEILALPLDEKFEKYPLYDTLGKKIDGIGNYINYKNMVVDRKGCMSEELKEEYYLNEKAEKEVYFVAPECLTEKEYEDSTEQVEKKIYLIPKRESKNILMNKSYYVKNGNISELLLFINYNEIKKINFYQDGKISSKHTQKYFDNGVMEDEIIYFDHSGKIYSEQILGWMPSVKLPVKRIEKSYFENGTKYFELFYEKKESTVVPSGITKIYYESGRLKREYQFILKEPEKGEWIEINYGFYRDYDKNGKLFDGEVFFNGVLYKETNAESSFYNTENNKIDEIHIINAMKSSLIFAYDGNIKCLTNKLNESAKTLDEAKELLKTIIQSSVESTYSEDIVFYHKIKEQMDDSIDKSFEFKKIIDNDKVKIYEIKVGRYNNIKIINGIIGGDPLIFKWEYRDDDEYNKSKLKGCEIKSTKKTDKLIE